MVCVGFKLGEFFCEGCGCIVGEESLTVQEGTGFMCLVLVQGLSFSEVNEIDNRGSTFYVALFWAQAMKQYDPSFR